MMVDRDSKTCPICQYEFTDGYSTPVKWVAILLIAIFLLAITNFYLQAQLLMKKPVIKPVVYASSAVDLILIS